MSIYYRSQAENAPFDNNTIDNKSDEEISAISFRQTIPSPTPFFGGFIQVMLCLSVIGFPIAILYGIIRGIIEHNYLKKIRVLINAVTITNSNFFTIFVEQKFNINISDIKAISASEKSNISFGMFPFAIITHNYTYGVLKIKTSSETFRIKNITNVYGVSKVLDYLSQNPHLIDMLLTSNKKTLYDFYDVIHYISNSENSKSSKVSIEEFFNSL